MILSLKRKATGLRKNRNRGYSTHEVRMKPSGKAYSNLITLAYVIKKGFVNLTLHSWRRSHSLTPTNSMGLT